MKHPTAAVPFCKPFAFRLVLAMLALALVAPAALAQEYPLGDTGKPDDYDQTIRHFDQSYGGYDQFVDALPHGFNWMDQGVVTSAKNQGACGSCYAFAGVGSMESKILMDGGAKEDLSEQQIVSCDTTMYACNGGSASVLKFWTDNGPMRESCTGYRPEDNVQCSDLDNCEQLPPRVKNYYTVDTSDFRQIQTSLQNDGPTYFRYDVYSDFFTFWSEATPGDVYRQSSGSLKGGHAVLIVGWDGYKMAWLCKNSWGETAGPNGDGTFWIGYAGSHANDLNFGMSNYYIQTAGPPDPEDAKLTANDGAANDWFGYATSISGNAALVGAYWDDDAGEASGAAYVFRLANGQWTQEAKLTAGDPAAKEQFGYTVSIDGDIAIVGANQDGEKGQFAGAAYVFKHSGGTWTQTAKLIASDGKADVYFGESVALSGNVAVVGAPYDDEKGGYAGAAYVFENSGGTWTQTAKLTAGDAEGGEEFGHNVAISGEDIVVGASWDDEKAFGAGAAYIFTRNGSNWTQATKLLANDGELNDHFGGVVAISGDHAVIGSGGDDDKGETAGAAYIFRRSSGAWSQEAKLTAADGVKDDHFGVSVAIDGEYAVIGASHTDEVAFNNGAAYVFARESGKWNQIQKYFPEDGIATGYFGASAGISGKTLAIGASGDEDKGENAGAVYIRGLSVSKKTPDIAVNPESHDFGKVQVD